MTVSRNPSISLSDHHRALVHALVESGRRHGVSEVVRKSLDSGSAGDLDLNAIVADAEHRAAAG